MAVSNKFRCKVARHSIHLPHIPVAYSSREGLCMRSGCGGHQDLCWDRSCGTLITIGCCAMRYRRASPCATPDILVTARGDTYCTVILRATVAIVISRIRRPGLELALHRPEAICFHGPPPGFGLCCHFEPV